MNELRQQRRNIVLGAASGFALMACRGSAQPGAGGRTPFTRQLERMFVSADNTQFDPASYSFENSGMCVVSADAIDGPYYAEDSFMVRSDLREGKEGVPLEVLFQVVDVNNGCAPLVDAAVDLWQCDSQGLYSRYTGYNPMVWPTGGAAAPTDDETFLRGRQLTDEAGMVQFQTIYPGWYSPRTQHLHAKVYPAEGGVATVQLYFPERLNREISLLSPYNSRSPSPFNNANDIVIAQSGGADGSWLFMTEQDAGYRGSLTLGVAL